MHNVHACAFIEKISMEVKPIFTASEDDSLMFDVGEHQTGGGGGGGGGVCLTAGMWMVPSDWPELCADQVQAIVPCFQVILVRKNKGMDSGRVFAMKILKKVVISASAHS